MMPMFRFSLRVALAALTLGCAAVLAGDMDSFFRAIRQDNESAMRELLLRGVDPNLVDENGTPGLHLALREESLRVAQLLVASPRLTAETRNQADESTLMLAAIKGQPDLVRQLLDKGAQVNKSGWAPLHYAASGGNLEVINQLLQAHAELDAPSPNGTTPLMMAAAYGTPEAVKLLIESGANIDARNAKGMTALDFANQASRPDAISLLTQAARYKARTPRPAPATATATATATAGAMAAPVTMPAATPMPAAAAASPVMGGNAMPAAPIAGRATTYIAAPAPNQAVQTTGKEPWPGIAAGNHPMDVGAALPAPAAPTVAEQITPPVVMPEPPAMRERRPPERTRGHW